MDKDTQSGEIDDALRELLETRDRSLNPDQLEIPPAIETDLRRELAVAISTRIVRRTRGSFDWPDWRTGALAAAACLIFSLSLVSLGKWPSRQKSKAGSRETNEAAPLLPAARDQFSLRVSPAELSAMRATFLALNRANPRAGEEDEGMRLDLLVRPILLGEIAVQTP